MVVIVGAGVAGLAAAARVRRAGLECVLLEAASRIGGRAWTTRPDALGGAAFDHGAAWLHASERNKLADLARACGDTLIDSDATRQERVFMKGALAGPDDLASYESAQAAFARAAELRLGAEQVDTSLTDAVADLANPWNATVATWEGPIIAAADARALSLQDWKANQLAGGNLEVEGGLGAFVARRLGPPAGPVWLDTPATRIDWSGRLIRVDTPDGTLACDACIVTVSTGVLAAGDIAFAPGLPSATQAAIDGLPMGLLTKVALAAAGADRLDLPDSCGIEQRVAAIDDPAMMFIAWPHGQGHMIGLVGGSAAWGLADGGAEAFARDQLRGVFGSRADTVFASPAVVTGWGRDPFTRGAYAYARPGRAGARAALGTPVDGRLIFAGEATRTDGLAGTVAGAALAGQDAAATAIKACAAG